MIYRLVPAEYPLSMARSISSRITQELLSYNLLESQRKYLTLQDAVFFSSEKVQWFIGEYLQEYKVLINKSDEMIYKGGVRT
jgi:hypothetical protein